MARKRFILTYALRRLISPTVYYRDDRGRRVPARFTWLESCELDDGPEADKPDTRDLSLGDSVPRAAPRGRLSFSRAARMARGLAMMGPALIVLMSCVAMTALALLGVAYFLDGLASNLRTSLVGAGAICAAALAALFVVFRFTVGKMQRVKRGPKIIAGALRRLRCGACGYSLAEVEPEQDGCRCCPECGAAWQVETWARPRT